MSRDRDREVEELARQLDQRYAPGPKKMADVLAALMARRGYGQVESARDRQRAWRAAVGQELAVETRPGGIRRGVLDVIVRNSAVLQELSFRKKRVIEKLKELAPAHRIRDVRFRVGPLD